ncbi:MAG TPA: thiol reductant ABC exporter subunit CydD [Dermatophilaceae bacterium]|nr:thiol reductant ABC exporter subunit CydD [Dermatophilaceae bacterium]
MRPFDRRVLSALPEARQILAGLGAVGILQGIVAVAQAFAVANLVVSVVRSLGDSPGTAGMPPADLPRALLVVGAAFAIRAGLGAAAELLAAAGGVHVSTAVRERLLTRWLTLPADDRPDPVVANTLATQGATTIEPYVARFLPALVGAAVLPVLVVVTIATIDWVSALVVVLTVPLLPVFAALIGRATQDQTERRWRALTSLSGHFLDVVRGLPTLVSYGRAERQAETIGQVSERHRAATVQTLRIAFLSSAALELLATVSVAIVAVTVGLRLTNGTMELAPGLVCILLAPEAYWPIRRVGTEYHAAADGVAALGQALDELDRPVPAAAPPAAADAATTPVVAGVAYRYPGTENDVLDDITVELPAAGLVAVTGPSGAGKTTLLELLAGLRRPSRGTVHTPSAHVVSQRPLLVAGTLRDNLTLGLDPVPSDTALWAALRAVGLDTDLLALPAGLDTVLGDDGFGLSAGQRARLALARATLSDAPLMLFDEPTAHLDDRSAALAHKVIRDLARTRAIVVVSHRPELVALADQVVAVPAAGVRR